MWQSLVKVEHCIFQLPYHVRNAVTQNNGKGEANTIDQEIFTLKIICIKIFVLINFRGLFDLRNF